MSDRSRRDQVGEDGSVGAGHDPAWGPATRAIHVGQDPDPSTGATVPPIYATSTYTQAAPGEHKGFEYSRTDNPTRRNLEAALASMEEGAGAASFSSGLAASSAILQSLLRPGQSVLAFSDLYGGTYRLFEKVMRPWGLDARYTDGRSPADFLDRLDPAVRMVWIETPTNPMLHLLDIKAISSALRRARPGAWNEPEGLLIVVDNTFATPALQKPLALGADLVLHSTTKYVGGHSDLVGGAVAAGTTELLAPIRFHQNAAGAVPGPFDCYLSHRGLKTLPLRMERHCENAAEIAWWASKQQAFSRVIYPGLPDHPDHEVTRRQMSGRGGGMVTCVLRDGLEAARRLMSRTRLFACAESLGGVESLINHPAIMTHASVPAEIRRRIGIADGLVRLSVGIEDVEDLIRDLEEALGGADSSMSVS